MCDRGDPALCPVPGMHRHVPLGPLPSLHLLRWFLGATVVRRLPRYSEAVRLPAPVHHGRTPWVPRADLAPLCQARCRASRVPLTVFPCRPEVSDPAGSVTTLPKRYPRCRLPRVRSASAPAIALPPRACATRSSPPWTSAFGRPSPALSSDGAEPHRLACRPRPRQYWPTISMFDGATTACWMATCTSRKQRSRRLLA
jgi:hypothetical protein